MSDVEEVHTVRIHVDKQAEETPAVVPPPSATLPASGSSASSRPKIIIANGKKKNESFDIGAGGVTPVPAPSGRSTPTKEKETGTIVELQSLNNKSANGNGNNNETTESINVGDMARQASPSVVSPTAGLFQSDQFPLSIENLQRLFKTETTPAEVVNIIENEYHGIPGLMKSLATEPTGLDAEMCAALSQSVSERINMYGENILPVKEMKTFWDFCEDVLEDTMLRILMVAGGISIALGEVEDQTSGWYEGAAIWFAIFLVTIVSSINNFQQQKQFAAVDVSKELDPVTVIRSGRQFSMDPTEVLVGDLVALAAGQRIPADGIMIQMKGKEVKVNESSATGETGLVNKQLGSRPLMMSGTEVVSGSCVMLVVLVGINTSYGQTLASLVEEDRETPLQKKLAKVAELIGWMGTGFAAATFIALLCYWINDVQPHKPSTGQWSNLLDIAVVCISIIVVAVPEGLPLAVTVSLAYSMKAMLKDHILVRELAACETMGNATAICSDKTGTLTQNRMTVQRVYLQQQMMDRPPAHEDIHVNLLRLLEQSIILNSAAWIEDENIILTQPPQDWAWKDGNQTEIALLSWLISYGFDVNQSRARHGGQLKASEPFDSIKKYSSIILERTPEEIQAEGGKRYRQFYKGAAEAIIGQTDRQLNKFGQPVPLAAPGASNIHRDLLDTVSEFSRRGLRVIAFGYRDMDELPVKKEEKMAVEGVDANGADKEEHKETEAEAVAKEQAEVDSAVPVTDAVLIGMVGLSDPLRPTSYRSVRLCQRAGIIVRMVTGDHVETARFISRECGIWTSKHHLCMTGAEFRKMMAEEDEETKKLKVSRLRVLARSSPQDKQVLVKFLQDQGEVVAATGDGTNDAPALKAADVGIAMFQSGTAVCKSAADLWLMDDNFASIVAAVVWGRCVFDNIRKFLAFQLTVNIVALFLSFIGALTNYPLPLTTVQLLWVNLIMDTAAAVALGTEQPVPEELLSRKPKPPDTSLVNKAMWYKIFTQGAYQLAVVLFLLYKADLLFPELSGYDDNGDALWKGRKHYTVVFNTFVWLQLGNAFNARRVDPSINVFGKMFDNAYFISIIFFCMGMQVLMVEVFGSFANTSRQTWQMWVCAFVCGFASVILGIFYALIWKVLIRFFPNLAKDDIVDPLADMAFEGAHLQDSRYSFKRPDNADEPSRIRAHSRHSFSHVGDKPADGPVAMGLASGSNSRLMSSMSARRANPTGSARRPNHSAVSFHAVGNEGAEAHAGELELAAAAPVQSGPTKEQLAASASWPRAPIDEGTIASQKALGSHTKQQHGGVQVIEELDELI